MYLKGCNWDVLHTIVTLAQKNRLAMIHYEKPGTKSRSVRTIEAYEMVEYAQSCCLRAFQIHPECDGSPWRTFRIDRIVDVMEGKTAFKPRRKIMLAYEHVEGLKIHSQQLPSTSVASYREAFFSAVSDGRFDLTERARLADMVEHLSTDDRKLVHSQVFMQVMLDVTLDGEISRDEDEWISEVRSLMDEFGWSP